MVSPQDEPHESPGDGTLLRESRILYSETQISILHHQALFKQLIVRYAINYDPLVFRIILIRYH